MKLKSYVVKDFMNLSTDKTNTGTLNGGLDCRIGSPTTSISIQDNMYLYKLQQVQKMEKQSMFHLAT